LLLIQPFDVELVHIHACTFYWCISLLCCIWIWNNS